MALSAAERTARARLAAYSMHARNDARATTAKARATFLSGFEDEVDPDRTLSESERQRRAEAARKAHMARLTLMRLRTRAKKTTTAPRNAVADEVEEAGGDGDSSA